MTSSTPIQKWGGVRLPRLGSHADRFGGLEVEHPSARVMRLVSDRRDRVAVCLSHSSPRRSRRLARRGMGSVAGYPFVERRFKRGENPKKTGIGRFAVGWLYSTSVVKNLFKAPLLSVSLSDIISSWITNTGKSLKPFSRSRSGQIFFGMMLSLCSPLWALKFQRVMAQGFESL